MSMSWLCRLFEPLAQPDPEPWNRRRPGTFEREAFTFTARLPSTGDGLWFGATFDVKVDLYGNDEGERLQTVARVKDTLVEAAYTIARGYALGDHGLAETRLFRHLNTLDELDGDDVDGLLVQVALTVAEEDIALERQCELVEQRARLARAEHRARMRRVEELITEVFKDPTTARMWWFEQNQDRWNDLKGAGEALDELVALCARRDEPAQESIPDPLNEAERWEDPVPDDPILAAFLSGVDGKQRKALLGRLTDILDAYGRPDLIERLHESWSTE